MPRYNMQIVFQIFFIDTFKISKGDNFTWMICNLDFQYPVYQCMVAQFWVINNNWVNNNNLWNFVWGGAKQDFIRGIRKIYTSY